ncbi:MAG TPA: CBS domain-containing protein [Bdellovibrionota bacterium]|nr:CBS domain-containing protein [Bdellovibrionota bacterium]
MKKVKDIMTSEVFFVHPDDKLDLAEDLMRWQRIRHVPVVDQSRHVVGMLTHRDLLKAAVSSLARLPKNRQEEIFAHVIVKEIMRKKVLTTTPETDLREVAALMLDTKVGCLPVINHEKRLVGIVTEADFLTLSWDVE